MNCSLNLNLNQIIELEPTAPLKNIGFSGQILLKLRLC